MTTGKPSQRNVENSTMNAYKNSEESPISSKTSGTACVIPEKKSDSEYAVHSLQCVKHAIEFLRIYREKAGIRTVPIVQLLMVQHQIEDLLNDTADIRKKIINR